MDYIGNLTIRQYQELYKIGKSKADETDKAIESVCIVTGKTAREVEEMKMHEFQELSRAVVYAFENAKLNTSPVPFLKANGKLYHINYVVSELRYGQYVEIQHWLQGDLIENMHNILASLASPVKKFMILKSVGENDSKRHREIAENILDAKFSDAYGCIVFFYQIFSASINSLRDYLKSEILMSGKMTENQVNKLMTDLTNVMDGFTIPRESLN